MLEAHPGFVYALTASVPSWSTRTDFHRVDCGEKEVVLLDFDHLSNKKFNVSKVVAQRWLWESILEEINKCDVRCVSCHRRKTAREQNWFRAGGDNGNMPVLHAGDTGSTPVRSTK